MKEKTPNLVEGRLGTPSLTPQESDGQAAGTSTNYGVGRLGITSDSSLEAPGQHADTPTSEELSSLAKARDVAAQAAAAEAEADRQAGGFGEASLAPDARPNHRNLILLSAGAFGGMAVVALVLVVAWCFGGDGAAPQAASAGEGSSKPVENVARATPPKPQAQNQGKPTPASAADTESQAYARGSLSPPSQARPANVQEPGWRPWEDDTLASAGMPASFEAAQEPPWLAQMTPRLQSDPHRPNTAPWETSASGPKAKRPTTAPAPSTKRGKSGRRPAAPPASDKQQATGLEVSPAGIEVSCIFRSPNGPAAIINNRLVTVGKTINKAKVVRIGKFAVEIELEGRRFQIAVSSPTGAKPPPADEAPKEEDPKEEPADDEPEKEKEKES